MRARGSIVFPSSHLLADRRRHVLRRLRSLRRHHGARRDIAKQIPDLAAECAVHLAHLLWDDDRGPDHRLSRRPLRSAFTYQFNLMIFGLASLAAAFAPDMQTLNI